MIRVTRPLLFVLPLLVLGCGGDSSPEPAPATATAPPAAPAAASEPETPAPADAFGYYLLDADKPQPDWAAKIDHLHLSTIEMKGEEMVTVPLWGFIRPKAGDDYPLTEVKQEGSRLTFSTQEVGGISFEFDGRFLASGNFPETPPQGVALAGQLRRRQGGQAAGEMNAEFLYTPGD
jgi:hypothetical protein